MPPRTEERQGLGFAVAILLSAIGHIALAILFFIVLPQWFTERPMPAPIYTVKIVDSLPAGDLGTHLPKLHGRSKPKLEPQPPPEPPPPPPKEEAHAVEKPPAPPKAPIKIEAPPEDKNAIALGNATGTPTPTPAPTPTPRPTPKPTPRPTPSPAPHHTHRPTPRPTPSPMRKHVVIPKPKPTPAPRPIEHRVPRAKPTHNLQKTRPTPKARPTPNAALANRENALSVKEQLARVRQQLLKEHLAEVVKDKEHENDADEDDSDEGTAASASKGGTETGGGPVQADRASAGHGYGIGSGTGSAGILRDADFLVYYRSVQERIKQAWSFSGGNNELTTTVSFAIGAQGQVTAIKVMRSSKNAAFDDSVVRAIRRAAPLPQPPEKYRDQFNQGIEAVFKLGELNS